MFRAAEWMIFPPDALLTVNIRHAAKLLLFREQTTIRVMNALVDAKLEIVFDLGRGGRRAEKKKCPDQY